jgi:hypothetical protein
MRMLLLTLLLLASPAASAAEAQAPIPTGSDGKLIVFETRGLLCVLYVNTGGMAGGAGTLTCHPLPDLNGRQRTDRGVRFLEEVEAE